MGGLGDSYDDEHGLGELEEQLSESNEDCHGFGESVHGLGESQRRTPNLFWLRLRAVSWTG